MTNRAFRIHAFGGPDVLQAEEILIPEPGVGEVVVAVKAAGVNQLDWKFLEEMVRGFSIPFPVTLGVEFAGVVSQTGEGVDGFVVGDRVMGFLHGLGAYTDNLKVGASLLARIPEELTDVQAAALPIALTTAWQALHVAGELDRGASVLVHGAAGVVGSIAVQLAKAAGAFVAATASRANLDYVATLGADLVIDYGAERFEDRVGPVDLVLDLVGGETLDRSWSVLSSRGAIASAAQFDIVQRTPSGARAFWVMAQPDPALLERLAGEVVAGRLRSTIAEVFATSDLASAIESTRRTRKPGKTVIDFMR
ncbi:MAG: NADP-dependent oxidoreductase [Janthinobacterium lividum]